MTELRVPSELGYRVAWDTVPLCHTVPRGILQVSFVADQMDEFLIDAPDLLGLKAISIGHDGTGESPHW